MTGFLSPTHIALLLVVLLLLFGAKKLPELGRSLGGGMREFKHSLTGDTGERPMLAAVPDPETAPARATDPTTIRPAASQDGAAPSSDTAPPTAA